MFTASWLSQPMCRLVTLTLLHFFWQGLAIAAALTVIADACRLRRAADRYACSFAALLTMALCPLATFACLWVRQTEYPPASDSIAASLQRTPLGLSSRWQWLDAGQELALAAWLVGVMFFGSRLLLGAAGLVALRRSRLPLPHKLAITAQQLAQRIHIKAAPLVFLSRHVADAMVIGLIRPLVLVPASWATELPPEMLEAVIAHELAHLRRHDLWVNLLQRIVETLLFYHPAVWWVSGRLRVERELCCDELAVTATGKRLEYAQALEQIGHQRQADIRPALAAFLRGETNMRLLQRVQNVLGQSPSEPSRLWPAGILALAIPLGLWAAATLGGTAIADDDRDEPKKPAIKRERDRDPRAVEEREERVIVRRPGQEAQEIIERVLADRDGNKRRVVVVEARDEERGDQRSERGGDRRLDELTAMVKRLASQVERLQDEVSQLRGQRPGGKEQNRIEPKPSPAKQRADDEIGARKRELQEASEKVETARRALQLDSEKIEMARRALAEKEKVLAEMAAKRAREAVAERPIKDRVEIELADKKRAIEEKVREAREKKDAGERERSRNRDEREIDQQKRKAEEQVRAAREKAEAAREKAEASGDKIKKELQQKLERLKEAKEGLEDIDADFDVGVTIKKMLRGEQALLNTPRPEAKPKPQPRKGDY